MLLHCLNLFFSSSSHPEPFLGWHIRSFFPYDKAPSASPISSPPVPKQVLYALVHELLPSPRALALPQLPVFANAVPLQKISFTALSLWGTPLHSKFIAPFSVIFWKHQVVLITPSPGTPLALTGICHSTENSYCTRLLTCPSTLVEHFEATNHIISHIKLLIKICPMNELMWNRLTRGCLS